MEDRFKDNGDGTVTDSGTGLMWKQDDSYLDLKKFLSFTRAKKYLEKINGDAFAGYSDWRMPSKQEAHSLFHQEKDKVIEDKYEMALYIDPVFTPGCGFDTWTSQTRGRITAYVYSFGSGSGGHKEVDDILNTSVRLVRGTIDPNAKFQAVKIPARKGMIVTDQR